LLIAIKSMLDLQNMWNSRTYSNQKGSRGAEVL
jgi:hypothetical protein